jgi:hypothetical protein
MRRIIVLCVLFATACTEEERTPLNYTEAAEQSATSVADTSTRPMSIIPNPQDTAVPPPASKPGSLTVAIAPTTNLAPSGSATLKSDGGPATTVSVTLTSKTGAAHFEGMIREGTCKLLGAFVDGLNPVSTDSLGRSARSVSMITVPLDSLRARPHAIVYGPGARPYSCGNIK